MNERNVMEWPKRARTAKFENGILILDSEKHFNVSELTMEIMEHLASYNLVGLHIKNYPVTDGMLTPFIGHKNIINFGVEYGDITDNCLTTFINMPKLRILLLDGNLSIKGISLSALKECKLELLSLNNTSISDDGLMQAASILKLTHIQIDHTDVTYDGLMSITDNSKIVPVALEQFTKEQMEHFFNIQRQKAKKSIVLNEQDVEECHVVLSAFFKEMTVWEQYVDKVGFEDKEVMPRLMAILEKYVSEKPRLGFRPLGLSYSSKGTYIDEHFLDAEQITRNKLCIYTKDKNTGFERRFLIKRVAKSWEIHAVQMRLDNWQRIGL